MTNIAVIENKISAVQKYLNILERYKKYSIKELEDNLDLRGALERYLYLATQAAIDTAEAFISLRNFRKPTTLRESFEILREEKIIHEDLMQKMVQMVGFRNIIANDYETVDYKKVYDVLRNRLPDLTQFILKIEKSL